MNLASHHLIQSTISALVDNKVYSRQIARFCVEKFFCSYFSCSKGALYTCPLPENEEKKKELAGMLDRLCRGEPVEYILGKGDFFGLSLEITPDVLIPRPETELMIDFLLQKKTTYTSILDLCTGSGCIALALKKTFPNALVYGADQSEKALGVAQTNSRKLELDVIYKKGDLLEPFEADRKMFDLVVCNPPYIQESVWRSLPPSVRDYEPKEALVGGCFGLEFYERLATELPPLLRSHATVLFEIGFDQKERVLNIFSSPCWQEPLVFKDWGGCDRFFSAIFLEGQ